MENQAVSLYSYDDSIQGKIREIPPRQKRARKQICFRAQLVFGNQKDAMLFFSTRFECTPAVKRRGFISKSLFLAKTIDQFIMALFVISLIEFLL